MNFTIAGRIETRYLVYAAFAFFVLAVLATLLILPHNALKARGSAKLPMQSLGNKPVLQIELARSNADLLQIFLPGDTKVNLADATTGNNLDTLVFIPGYTGFLISLGLILGRSPRVSAHQRLMFIILLVPVIATLDWGENWGIAKAIHHIEVQGSPQPGDALRISNPSLLKWTLTMFVLAAFGIEALYTANWRWFPLAVLLFLLSSWIAIVLSSYARERWG